jgi:uncharacterized protein (DUF2141 family)
MSRLSLVAIGLLAITFVGCGGDGLNRVEIEGLVKAQNGPVKNASVQFIPQAGTPGEGAIGVADDQGKFTVISSRDQDGGLPAGKYRVRVNQMIDGDGTVLPAEATQAEHPFSKEGVPTPFSTPESTLEIEVPESGGQVTIDLPVKTKGK